MNYFDSKELQKFTQQTAEAICLVLGMQVTIVDSNVRRVAGTGCFSRAINESLPINYVFTRVITTGEMCLIEDPGQTVYCAQCLEKNTCKEKATLLIPVKQDDTIIGGIGLVAMTEGDKNRLLKNQENFTVFMSKMADLLAAKVKSEQTMKEYILLTKNLAAVTDTFTDGIISINSENMITHFNRHAELILHIQSHNVLNRDFREILECSIFDSALKTPMNAENLKGTIVIDNVPMTMMISIRTIVHNDIIQGIVAFFQEIANTKKKYESALMSNTRYTFDSIQGNSKEIKSCIEMAKRISQSNSSVLIFGESGTGKELFARSIHNESNRRNNNFVAINCSAIPDALLESELFGYVGGSFTGAKKEGHAGKFEVANGGTIFLDEIGDMPLNLQAKLLRVLQDRVIERVGSSSSMVINVRVIAATNKNLDELISKNLFRQDLYYRINVIPINIPPLRERKGDILTISQFLLKRYSLLLIKEVDGFATDAMNMLLNYKWYGNIRELENVIEYAMNMESGKSISMGSLPQYLMNSKSLAETKISNPPVISETEGLMKKSLKEYSIESEKTQITNALSQFGTTTNEKRQCAKYLNISLSTLYRKMKEFNIE